MHLNTSVLPALVPVRNQTRSVHWCVVLAVPVLMAQCCMRGSVSPKRSVPRKVRDNDSRQNKQTRHKSDWYETVMSVCHMTVT